ncbi:MAG: AraC family transcriptional regulator [Acidobacteriota bacterium]
MLWKVQKMVEYIESNLDQQLTLDAIAGSVRLSRSRMCHLFRTQTGIAPWRYLQVRRMEKARNLLESTSLSVKEVRASVGLQDRSHFVREFKKAYGTTPSRYRANGISV